MHDDDIDMRYQPVVDVLTGSSTGLEAQPQWNLPSGDVLDGDSVGLFAESQGLAERIGELSVRRVVADLAHSRGRGFDLAVTVPISTIQVTAPGFAVWLLDLLSKAEVPARRLTIEVSEHSLSSHPSLTRATLWALRSAGLGVQLSHLANVAGSLLLLRVAPITGIKVDEFVTSQLLSSPASEQTVAALLATAESLSLDTVVAGVSSPEQLLVLRRLGCRRALGPLWSSARPLEEAVGFHGPPRPRPVT